MKALIIANGNIQDYDLLNSLVQENEFILCADGGLNHLMQINKIPDLIVGDFDSVSQNAIDYISSNNINIQKFPKMKDETDTDLAINYLIEHDYKNITIIGGIGSRMDHTLGNIFLLKKILHNRINGCIVDENNRIYLVEENIELNKKQGFYTSVIPLSSEGIHISINGFLYPLNKDHLKFGSTRGISNKIIEDKATITIHKGLALVIQAKDN